MDIIFLTGLTASGKSTIAEKLGERLGIPVISLRDIYHHAAARNGFKRIRYWINAVGIPVMIEEGRKELIRALESNTNKTIIIDDLIDPETLTQVRTRFPEKVVLVVQVETEEQLREELITRRMTSNKESALAELCFLDGIKKQAGIESVIREATITIRNSGRINEVVTSLLEELELQLHNYGPERI